MSPLTDTTTVHEYLVIIEQAYDEHGQPSNLGAYVPDLPGCVVLGATFEEVEDLMRTAIELHLERMREDGVPIPPPTTRATTICAAS